MLALSDRKDTDKMGDGGKEGWWKDEGGRRELATLPELPPTFPLQLALGGLQDQRAGSAL